MRKRRAKTKRFCTVCREYRWFKFNPKIQHSECTACRRRRAWREPYEIHPDKCPACVGSNKTCRFCGGTGKIKDKYDEVENGCIES